MHSRLISVLLLLPLVATTACSGGDETASPTKTSSLPSPSATQATPSASPTSDAFPTTVPEAAKVASSAVVSSTARTSEEKAAVRSLGDYWKAVVRTYSTLEADPGLDVARGKPVTGVLDYLQSLKTRGLKVKGWTKQHVEDVDVSGDDATLKVCSENLSFEVDQQGKQAEPIIPFYRATVTMRKIDGRWIMIELVNQQSMKRCLT